MGMLGSIFKRKGLGAEELARRIGIPLDLLKGVRPKYREFKIRKASGGDRVIHDPEPKLKEIQRLILRRVLGRLAAHPAARAFERAESIATHAKVHAGQAIVLRLDVIDFFPSITVGRVLEYFMAVGWNQEAAELLAKLCLRDGRLPQGAPTSPRLSNLVNWKLDALLMYEAWFGKKQKFNVNNLVDDTSSDMGKYKTGSPGVAIHDQFADIEKVAA